MQSTKSQAPAMPGNGWVPTLLIACTVIGVAVAITLLYPAGFSPRGWLIETADDPGFWATLHGAPRPVSDSNAGLLPVAIVLGGAGGVAVGFALAMLISSWLARLDAARLAQHWQALRAQHEQELVSRRRRTREN